MRRDPLNSSGFVCIAMVGVGLQRERERGEGRQGMRLWPTALGQGHTMSPLHR
jgi:hypothetical protein